MRLALLWLALGIGACGGDADVFLSVDVRTDMLPGRDFDAVRVEVMPGRDPTDTIDMAVDLAADYSAGARVADVRGLRPRHRRVRVSLIEGGVVQLARDFAVDHRDDLLLVAVLTRSCVGVTCDDVAGVPQTCLAGRCVPTECGAEREPCGEPECSDDVSCAPAFECATTRCAEGTCLQVPDDARCTAPDVCIAEVGCGSDCRPESCPPGPVAEPGDVLLQETRASGPGGERDDYVVVYNDGDVELVVRTPDDTPGWSIVGSSGGALVELARIPRGTRLPPYGSFLAAGAGFSLGAMATPDTMLTGDLTAGGGLGLFRSTDPAHWTEADRLDAFGFGEDTPTVLREGAVAGGGDPPPAGRERAAIRRAGIGPPRFGRPGDTGDSVADWLAVATEPVSGEVLGAPAPRGTDGMRRPPEAGASVLLDPGYVVDSTPGDPVTSPFGTITQALSFTNPTASTIRELHYRIVSITTLGSADPMSATADVRLIDFPGGPQMISTGETLDLAAATLVGPPQPLGGGWNSAVRVDLPAGGLPPGGVVRFAVRFGIARMGTFSFRAAHEWR